MRTGLVYCVLGLCAVSQGCTLATHATRNVALEISDAVEDHWEAVEARKLTRTAWRQVRLPDMVASPPPPLASAVQLQKPEPVLPFPRTVAPEPSPERN